MAFFKFRKSADESASASAQPPSTEAIRQRAKYRLVGAAVLVLIGVVGLPLLFDKQPRPIAVDTPIDIPDKNKVVPLVIPATPATSAVPTVTSANGPTAAVVAQAVSKPQALPQPDIITETAEPPATDKVSDKKQAPARTDKASDATKQVAKELPKTSRPVASAAVAQPAEASRAQALLEGKEVAPKAAKTAAPEVSSPASPAAAAEGRFVVQVGAFAETARAQEVRLKVERAGLKTYTHVAETKDGRRIRVRVGPYSTRAEAEKAADKIKKLNLPAALLTL
ncbi:SPOR domain-containing protein [Rhodoferax sp.]|uniref:SPOR domain-containing protein n=1 Tax=Rhodoferax sp. TaxID=50421 RepID=UPI00262E21EC|nr:SPOR domain-containing protein [Rhodoferax sp.]MDD2926828.1 SPOR domain-containing protein [Rhodoferax sp.]